MSLGAKKVAKKRQKNRRKKHKGRKRRLKYIADFEADSSSFTDCTDEDIIRDYIANITADLSDSDVDSALRKGAFLMKRDLASSHDFGMPVSPEVDETDSFSESFRLTHSRKKRRRYKRHCVDGIDHQLNHVNSLQRKNIHDVLSKQFSKYVTYFFLSAIFFSGPWVLASSFIDKMPIVNVFCNANSIFI